MTTTQKNLLERLTELLSSDDRLVSEGKLLKNKVTELALSLDVSLLKLLLSDTAIKTHFFTEVDTVLVFDKIKFQKFVNNKQFLPDSYTAYKNKIGLTVNDEYLTDSKEVVLSFPYKDCILEGGQDKEDAKRDEIFWNETLAPDQIDRLLSPKLLTNFKRFDKDGEHTVNEVRPTDNLIIKGNNLLALHTLESQFAGKVKLIYIDPPYNTGSDSFKYNDTFTDSTWLTFINNRLREAHALLNKSGVLLVQINDHNQAYLKILLDEVFKKENFINVISIRTKSPSGFKTVNLGLFETAEYILMYGKSKNDFKYNQQYIDSGYDENYTGFISNISETPENWVIDDIRKIICREEGIDPETIHQPYSKAKEKIGEGLFFQKLADFALTNANSVFRLTAIGDDAGKETLDAKKKSKQNPDRILVVSREQNESRYILNGQEIAFYSKKVKEIDGEKIPTTILTNIWSDIAYEGIASEGGVTLKKGKKPEKLLRRIIEMSTNENDLVLDYHLGSGTTCAVAHKLKRQYIGIEQLNYGENDSVERLKNVINGDATGISKSVNWQGGGSFVYCELAKANQTFVDVITQATTTDELSAIWQDMKDRAFVSYKVNVRQINETKADFAELSLDDQKRFLIATLDQNMLYIPLSEMDDKTFKVSDADKALNKQFFNLGDV
jgi:adenine-specific DNA-methyltransferase